MFAIPALFGLMAQAPLYVILPLALIAIPGIAYALFALAVGFHAYAEWGDRFYDKHTKKYLPPEYGNSESATSARLREQAEKRG